MTQASSPPAVRKHSLALCEECSLYEAPYCPSAGPTEADIAIVGEAPGYQEALHGQPFVGPSGRLLDLVLKHHGIDRHAVLVTNTVACRPPQNRNPTPAETKCCQPRLRAELAGKSTILALGAYAAKAVLGGNAAITKARVGPPKFSPVIEGAQVVATFHPAAALRSGDYFPSIVTDVGKVARGVQIGWEPPKFRVFPDGVSAAGALQELLDQRFPTAVIDIETAFEKDAAFERPDHAELLCVGVGFDRGRVAVIGKGALQAPRVRHLLGELLRRKDIVAHNGKFDLAGLRAIGRGSLHSDTMLASYVADERGGVHGLKHLAVELLGAPEYHHEIERYTGRGAGFGSIPSDVLHRYNAYDVACTWGLWEHYNHTLDAEGQRLHRFLCTASDALLPIEVEGIAVDTDALDEVECEVIGELEKLEDGLKEWVDNPRSPMQVKASLAGQGIIVPDTTEDTLKLLIEKNRAAAFCERMLEHRGMTKLHGTYIKGLRKRLFENRAYPNFLLHGTTTGRLSCRNPNLQNIPRGSAIRRLFVPEAGSVFVQADYAQAELRVMAVLSRDPYLAEVLGDPSRDLHSEIAHDFFGHPPSKEERFNVKRVIFGVAYGRTAFDLARVFRITINEAQRFIDTFFAKTPALLAWRQRVVDTVMSGEDLVTPFGRHRRFWLITEENKKDVRNEALAFLPQSIASDICLSALVRLRQLGLAVRLPVHDSLLVECDRALAVDVGRTMAEVMESTAQETFAHGALPFPVEVKSGASWGEV